MIDFSRNHFELFGVPAQFRVHEAALEHAYRALQTEVHPDKHASSTDANRRMSLQASARVNEAYRTLRDPVLRAEYLLSLHGVKAGEETDTALSFDFLESALERRESVANAAAAGDERALEIMLDQVREESQSRQRELGHLLDVDHAWDAAREKVRELRFLAKLAQDIDVAIAQAET